MANRNPCLTRALRRAIYSTISIPIIFVAAEALAQDDAEDLEEITVTGSRITRDPNVGASVPVQSLTADDIKLAGPTDIGEVLNDMPSLLGSNSATNSVFGEFGSGSGETGGAAEIGETILQLRGLGVERTLVLVDGRRHVAGVGGSQAVDIGSIPTQLIERVEVSTGGASAVYGADAVTGVVNFIMMDNFEGFNVDLSYGISSDGDGGQTAITATWGTNFAGDRGNFVVSVDYRTDDGLKMGDRPGALFGTGGDLVNPALRFQIGDIGSSTPLFEQFYNYANTGLYHYGLSIPPTTDFIADYNAEFGTAITAADLSPAEVALLDRGANAPARAVHPESTFWLTSGYGTVAPGEAFGFTGFFEAEFLPEDRDGDGTPDCLQSWSGYNMTFARGAFGAIGGCWMIQPDGTYMPNVDGLIVSASGGQGFGGSSYDVYRQDYFDFLLPDDKVSVNLLGHYDISDSATLFGELKYVTQETDTSADPNSFWDLIPAAPDNPFLPPWLSAIAADPAVDGISITIDPVLFRAHRTTERETTRAVVGIEGEFDNSWNYEVSANYGRYEQNIDRTNQLIIDRWFAALDATTDGAGNP
ncbi:MAG: TonB-dependent receptor plug domain-containing protein, partial [Proteobacteria bacterium]|nr:TonB-dependent receptor plug domain-containing protein [Pseudomonadota bacterium]